MRIAFFSAAMLAAGANIAAVPIDGWYSSAFGGFSYLWDEVHRERFDLIRHHDKYHWGYHVGGRLGYQSNPMRYEAEVTYINAALSGFRINRIPQRRVKGALSATMGMANVYYDFPDMVPAISPFLGAGLGFAYINIFMDSKGPIRRTRFEDSDTVFAFQATAGLTYNFAENYAANIAYRYVGTQTVNALGRMFQANLATVGVIYRFDGNSYK